MAASIGPRCGAVKHTLGQDRRPPKDGTLFLAMVEVSWNLDATTLYATLVRPAQPEPVPGVVFVAGSGPTDRDWTSPLLPGSNGSAALIAQSLEKTGFASLRYDKRASGPHAMDNMRLLFGKLDMQSHVDELAGAVRTLAAQDFVRADRIFALASSEGTLHALNYQIREPAIPLAGLVLVGPPGRSVGVVARAQLAEQAQSLPNAGALMTLYDQAIARFTAGQPAAPDAALPEGAQALLQALEAPANLPFARELWTAEASSLLTQVDAPVLVIIGKKDIQVDWQADGEPLQRAAAGRPDVSFQFPDTANHVLKYEPRPRSELTAADVVARYNAPDQDLDPVSMASIQTWLAEHL